MGNETDANTPAASSATHHVNTDDDVSWGRTASGRVFRVPVTHDMLKNLFTVFPPTRKSHTAGEFLTLGIVAVHTLSFFVVLAVHGTIPFGWQMWYTVAFIMWRLAYNAGLGIVLKRQSESQWFTKLCINSGIFDRETAEKSEEGKRRYQWLKGELSKKMDTDYDFDSAPVEFNAWLVYRNLVDLILVNDFTAYMVFACAFFKPPTWAEFGMLDVLRYVAGIALMAFNVWVKRDAHRVVKDFAWYWGDFFFLVDKSLTFDGVFEMAPHPMYSVGYVGFYGMALITDSFMVLCISLLAHAAQFVFLYFAEEPHIQKTYGSGAASGVANDVRKREILFSYFRRDAIGPINVDLYRSTDLFLLWTMLFSGFLALPLESTLGIRIPASFFLGQAVVWRCIHSFALGSVLSMQSRKKTWTRHFIQVGGSNRDAFASWKSVYNFSSTMVYFSFLLATFKCFVFPESAVSWIGFTFLWRQLLGVLLVGLHTWISTSVHEVLGDFGWFYGDFFIDEFPAQLHYTGIYRYLNNPEKIAGQAAFWGLAMMSGSGQVFLLALFSFLANWWFLEAVEAPHMKKIYGTKVRQESGVTKTVKKQLAEPVLRTLEKQKLVGEVNAIVKEINKVGSDVRSKMEMLVADKITGKVKSEVEKVIELAKPKIDDLLADTRMKLVETTSRLATLGSLTNAPLAEDGEINVSQYAVHLAGRSSSAALRQSSDSFGCVTFGLGEPINVYWTAPRKHSPRDWIGCYKVTENPSPTATTVQARHRWAYVECEGETAGQLVFSGDRVPWEVGVYEFRMHYADKYLVVARSGMFEVKVDSIPPLDDSLLQTPLRQLGNTTPPYPASPLLSPTNPNSLDSIVATLLPLYQRALGVDTITVKTDLFTLDPRPTEKQTARIAYGIKQMYGIDLNWRVIADIEPTPELIAERIQEARVILAPASSSWMLNKRVTGKRSEERVETALDPLDVSAMQTAALQTFMLDQQPIFSAEPHASAVTSQTGERKMSQNGETAAGSAPDEESNDQTRDMTVAKYLRMIEKDRAHRRSVSGGAGDTRSSAGSSGDRSRSVSPALSPDSPTHSRA